MRLTSQEVYDKLIHEDRILELQGQIKFFLGDVAIIVHQKDVVGNIIQEWLQGWLDKRGTVRSAAVTRCFGRWRILFQRLKKPYIKIRKHITKRLLGSVNLSIVTSSTTDSVWRFPAGRILKEPTKNSLHTAWQNTPYKHYADCFLRRLSG